MNTAKPFLIILTATAICFILSLASIKMAGPALTSSSFPQIFTKLYTQSQPTEFSTFTKEISASSILKVQVQTISADINILPSENDQIKIVVDGNFSKHTPESDLFTLTETGTQLTIQSVENKSSRFEFHSSEDLLKSLQSLNTLESSIKFIVYLPHNIQSASLKTVSGELQAKDISLADLELKSISGDITLNPTRLENIHLKTVSGETQLYGDIQLFNAESTSGDFSIQTQNLQPQITIQTISGNTMAELDKNADLKVQFSSLSGSMDVSSKYPKPTGNERQSSLKLGEGHGVFIVKSTSGDFSLQ